MYTNISLMNSPHILSTSRLIRSWSHFGTSARTSMHILSLKEIFAPARFCTRVNGSTLVLFLLCNSSIIYSIRRRCHSEVSIWVTHNWRHIREEITLWIHHCAHFRDVFRYRSVCISNLCLHWFIIFFQSFNFLFQLRDLLI